MSSSAGAVPESDRPAGADFDAGARPGYLMRRGVKQLSQLWAAQGLDMTIPQFAILVELDRNDGLDQRTLSDRVLIDPSTLTDVCRRLLARGDIQRVRDQSDQRRYTVTITPAGRASLAQALPQVHGIDDLLLARLTPAERQRFLHLFRKALDLDGELT